VTVDYVAVVEIEAASEAEAIEAAEEMNHLVTQ